MLEVLVWLLISESDGSYNRGNVSVVERFRTEEQCERVAKLLAKTSNNKFTYCIQSNVLVVK